MLVQNPVSHLTSGVFYCLLFIAGGAHMAKAADSPTPFYSRDQNPLVIIYGLPTPTPARILRPGQSRLVSSLNLSNTINGENDGSESLFVDVESYQLNLLYDHALNAQWMLRLQLPLIRHSSGFMDDWIDDYHDLLNLPENIRPDYPNDQIDIRYSDGGIQQLSLQQDTSGIGDVSLQTAYQARASDDGNLSYWISLKLPSGDSARLTGSGSTDLALWLAADQNLVDDLWVYGNLGIVLMSDSEVLPQRHNSSALFASAGLQLHPWQPLLIKFQFDGHSAFYDSANEFLGPVIQLTFGGTLILSPVSELDIAVAEDIQSGASPDVNFVFTWRRRFD
jgi:hypothetical protein